MSHSRKNVDDAYRAALYLAERGAWRATIRIGEIPTVTGAGALDREWAFITAWNPQSRKLSRNANKRRQRALLVLLAERFGDATLVDGESRSVDGKWREPSVLVIGIASEEALALGRRFDQRAIVVGKPGEPAELVWCRR